MISYPLRVELSVQHQFVAAHLLTEISAKLFLFFGILPLEEGKFIIFSIDPSVHLVLAKPAFMLHWGKNRSLFGIELCYHLIIYRFIGIEAVDGIEIPAETLCTVQGGKLIFQRQGIKLFFQFFSRCITLISSVQCNCKII